MNARISELLSRSKNQNKQISGMLDDHPKSHELKNLPKSLSFLAGGRASRTRRVTLQVYSTRSLILMRATAGSGLRQARAYFIFDIVCFN